MHNTFSTDFLVWAQSPYLGGMASRHRCVRCMHARMHDAMLGGSLRAGWPSRTVSLLSQARRPSRSATVWPSCHDVSLRFHRITSHHACATLRCLSLAKWMPSACGHARRHHAFNGAAARGPWPIADARTRPLRLDKGPSATTTAPRQGARSRISGRTCRPFIFPSTPLLSAAVASW